MKPLIIIPARGGSKGVPGKNIKLLNGVPLIHYTLDAAREIFEDRYICVSTDDEEIKKCVEAKGVTVPFLRPSELASDTAGTYDVLMHALQYYENQNYYPDVIIILQPTSPMRKANHIKEAVKLYNNEIDMIVSVKETKSNPYYVLFEEDGDGFLRKSKQANFVRRQDCPKVWEFNGAIYVINVNSLKRSQISDFSKVVKYQMDELSSHDIDSILDWKIAELIARED